MVEPPSPKIYSPDCTGPSLLWLHNQLLQLEKPYDWVWPGGSWGLQVNTLPWFYFQYVEPRILNQLISQGNMLVIYHELLLKSIYKSREDSSTSLCMQYDKIKAFGNCNKYWNCSPVKIKHQTILFHYLCWDEDISSQKTDKWQLHGRVYRIEIDPLKWFLGLHECSF